MKKIFTTFLAVVFCQTLLAQYKETNSIRNKNSSNCSSLGLKFMVSDNTIIKYDLSFNLITEYASKFDEADFDGRGNYVELYTSKFVLEDYGIDRYTNIKKYVYQIVYDKKGGDLLYIFEFNQDTGIDEGKFYFSALGEEKFCN
jgi:hypothetical protein